MSRAWQRFRSLPTWGQATAWAVLAVIVIAAIAGGGESGDEERADTTATAPTQEVKEQQTSCEPVSEEAVQALEASLRNGGQLRAARAIPSADSFQGPSALRENAYFIAAGLQGRDNPLVWLTTEDFVQTGEGLAIAATQGTRQVSELGADADPSLIGVSPESRGFAEVRECVSERLEQADEEARRIREEREAERRREAEARRARERRQQREREEQAQAEAEEQAEEDQAQQETEAEQDTGCDPNYSGCVPVFPPDVNCPDVDGPVQVLGDDPHGLDRDGDGTACDAG